MSLAENLALAARKGKHRGLGWALGKRIMREMRERIAPLRMGLERRLGERMGSLSGGERQALTLLMATWTRPKLLLLDEHTAALDPRAAEMVIQLTEETIRKDNLTTLMVTHSMQQAASLGDRILMMHKGRIIHDFSGDEKRRLKAQDLLDLFNEARRRDLLGDPS
jgi:putative ABC transport system ATP-binding protein